MGYFLPGEGPLVGENTRLDARESPTVVRLLGEADGHVPRSGLKCRNLAIGNYPARPSRRPSCHSTTAWQAGSF